MHRALSQAWGYSREHHTCMHSVDALERGWVLGRDHTKRCVRYEFGCGEREGSRC